MENLHDAVLAAVLKPTQSHFLTGDRGGAFVEKMALPWGASAAATVSQVP